MSAAVTVIDHPLVQHKLTQLRRRETPDWEFRRHVREIGMLIAYEVMRDLPLEKVEIHTPLTRMMAPQLAGRRVCFISVLRAGNGLLDGMLEILPSARVGHIGLYRDPTTLEAVEYYCKFPEDIAERDIIVLDPMLATGHSAAAAVERVKESGGVSIKYACVLSAPQGVETLGEAHPDVPIFTCAIDSHLNDHGYIMPGLGDAGDRLFGTK